MVLTDQFAGVLQTCECDLVCRRWLQVPHDRIQPLEVYKKFQRFTDVAFIAAKAKYIPH